jgi:hypothetical protein
MTKATHKKPAKEAGEKVSAPRRQSATLEERSNVLADDAHVETLVRDLGEMIEAARQQVAVAVNASLTTLYWEVGHRVRTEVLDERRAEYGAGIVAAVGRQLETRYGRGFGEKSLRHMIRFVEASATQKLSPRCGDNCRGVTSSSLSTFPMT